MKPWAKQRVHLARPGSLVLALLILSAAASSGTAGVIHPAWLSTATALQVSPADGLTDVDASRVKKLLEIERLALGEAGAERIRETLTAKAETFYRVFKGISPEAPITDGQKAAARNLALEALNSGEVPQPPPPAANHDLPAANPEPDDIEELKRPEGISPQVFENAYRTSRSLRNQLKEQGKGDPEIQKQVRARFERLFAAALKVEDPAKLSDEVKSFAGTLTEKVMNDVELTDKPPASTIRYEPFLDQIREETRKRNEAMIANGSDPQTEIHSRMLQEFAEKEARRLAQISGDLTDFEKDGIRTSVVGPELARGLKTPAERRGGGDVGQVPEPTRTRIDGLLAEIVNRVFPIVPGLDANSRKSNLIKFLKDNQSTLGIPESIAESLVEDFLKRNPGAIQPTTTTTTTLIPTTLVPTTLVQPATIGGNYVLVPYAKGWCPLFRR